MIEKRAVCRTNPGTADTRCHIVFLRVLEQSGALFLCPDWLSCPSRSGPPERQPKRQPCHIVPVSSMPTMCARPCVCLQNRNDMAASGAAPVSGVRVMGCVRGRGRGGYGRWSGRERSGALRYQFCIFWRGCCGMVLRSGLVRQSVRYASDRHNRCDN